MPAHSWAAPGGVRIQFNREFSSTRAPSLHELRDEGLDTVSMPNERTCREMLIPQRMARPGPSKAIRKPSPAAFASRPRNRANSFAQGRGVAAAVHPIFRCCLLRRIDDIGEKNCCQSSIRLGTGRIPVRNSSIPSSSASTVPSDKVAEIVRASL